MAEYILVRQEILHNFPDELSFKEAALTEPGAVAFNPVFVKSQPLPGDTVVIIVPGTIGLMALQMTLLSSPMQVIIAGLTRDRERLKIAGELGADRIVYANKDDPVNIVKSLGDGNGAHPVIDDVGIAGTLRQSIEMVRPNGQITKIGWDVNPLREYPRSAGSKGSDAAGHFQSYPGNVGTGNRTYGEKKVTVTPLSKTFPMNEWAKAFKKMDTLEIPKAVMLP